MGCGFGLCDTCAVPVARKDRIRLRQRSGRASTGRSSIPARILWDRWLDGTQADPATEPVGTMPGGGDGA